jgi:hypothetical protein
LNFVFTKILKDITIWHADEEGAREEGMRVLARKEKRVAARLRGRRDGLNYLIVVLLFCDTV